MNKWKKNCLPHCKLMLFTLCNLGKPFYNILLFRNNTAFPFMSQSLSAFRSMRKQMQVPFPLYLESKMIHRHPSLKTCWEYLTRWKTKSLYAWNLWVNHFAISSPSSDRPINTLAYNRFNQNGALQKMQIGRGVIFINEKCNEPFWRKLRRWRTDQKTKRIAK